MVMSEKMKFSFEMLVLQDLMQRGVIDSELYSKTYARLQELTASCKNVDEDAALASA